MDSVSSRGCHKPSGAVDRYTVSNSRVLLKSLIYLEIPMNIFPTYEGVKTLSCPRINAERISLAIRCVALIVMVYSSINLLRIFVILFEYI